MLPNYRIFDDERYFFSLQDVANDFGVPLKELFTPYVINVKGKHFNIGFEMCEDMWCDDYRLNRQTLNPTQMLVENGAEAIVNLSASPWTFGKNGARDRRVKARAKESGNKFVPFYYVNCTGAQNNGKNIVTFDGGTTVYNNQGKPVVFSKEAYEQELIVVDHAAPLQPRERREEPMIAQKYKALIKGIQHLQDITGSKQPPNFLIGLSGGIDSAINAALLAQAVGKDRVVGINMPTHYNSNATKNAARHVAEALDILYAEVPIQGAVDTIITLLNEADINGSGKMLSELNEENVQAKIRGTDILSNLAAKYGAIFSNNGNKVEVMLGYATLYGDWGGAIAILADITKTEEVALARYLNETVYGKEIIPETLLPDHVWRFSKDQIQPSAELKNDQVDPMKFGYHCALAAAITDYQKKTAENFMQAYIDGTLHTLLEPYIKGLLTDEDIMLQLMERWEVTHPQEFIQDLEWFMQKANTAVFKRIQAPPIIITSKTSYGYDFRESMLPWNPTLEYHRLKEKIMHMKGYNPQ